ncbi:MAG: 6-phosphofructokinase [Metamycoplasmataceae bacterium]
MIKKIAILTSGGDSQGMNNAIRSIVKSSYFFGLEPYLVYEGYKGLVEGNIKKTNLIDVDDYIARGGTFIFSARYPEFKQEEVRLKAKKNLDNLGIEALVVIGGDGSYQGAQLLHKIGVKTMALPGTIDNDISSTEFTIGFDTALNAITENVDRIRDTATSHKRCMIVEVMGRYAGDLALHAGIANGAELIITAENKMDISEISKIVNEQINVKNKKSMIIIVSEYVYESVADLAKSIEKETKVVTRATVLNHLQRGGTPTASERILATKMGYEATKLLVEGKSGLAICLNQNKINTFPILEALSKERIKLIEDIKLFNKINQQ